MKKPPDPKPIQGKPLIVTKKTALKNIVGEDPVVNIRIQRIVERTHVIVQHTTHFLKMYLLYLFEQDELFPILDKDFIALCMRAVSNMPNVQNRRGRPPKPETRLVLPRTIQTIAT